jgi:integrase
MLPHRRGQSDHYGNDVLMRAQPLRDIATMILHTGMRPEEVFRIEVRNVDLRQKAVFNPWGKTKAIKRTPPLDEEASRF